MTFLTETGRHRAQIVYFFRMYIGSRTPSGIGLRSGGPPDRMRRFLVLPESSGSKTLGDHGGDIWAAEHLSSYVSTAGSAPRMRRRRLSMSSTDPRRLPRDHRAKNRQDSTDAAVHAGPVISRIKNYFFSPPRKCPIDLFGPVANGRILKRLHAASIFP